MDLKIKDRITELLVKVMLICVAIYLVYGGVSLFLDPLLDFPPLMLIYVWSFYILVIPAFWIFLVAGIGVVCRLIWMRSQKSKNRN